MLETEIKKLTAAVEVLTATLTGNKVAAALSEKVAPAVKVKEAAQASPAAATPTVDPLDEALAIKPENVPDPATDVAPAAVEAATKQQVIDATIALATAKGRSAPVPVFDKFGIKKATECPEDKYGDLVVALTAALA